MEKLISELDNKCLITSHGHILNATTRKRLKTFINNRGYEMIKYSTYKGITIHRLVALYFLDNPLNRKEINHKDGNKLNNAVENLEWSNRKENFDHAVKMGSMDKFLSASERNRFK